MEIGRVTTPEAEVLLTPKQVVKYTNGLLSESTLAWWRHAGIGHLKWGRLGGRKIIYRKSDVDAFIAASFEDGKASA